jgi:hypothetical protein
MPDHAEHHQRDREPTQTRARRAARAPPGTCTRRPRTTRLCLASGRLTLVGLCLVATLAASMVAVGTASAAHWSVCLKETSGSTLTKWETHQCEKTKAAGGWEWSEPKTTEAVISHASLTLVAEELGVTVKVNCVGKNEGWIGSNGKGQTTAITVESCTAGANCEKLEKKAEPVNLPWNSELAETEGKIHATVRANVSGKNPGWRATCKVPLLGVVENECTSNEGLLVLENKNTPGNGAALLVLGVFTNKPKATCDHASEGGEVLGSTAFLLASGEGLRVSVGSGGGGAEEEATSTTLTTSLSGESKEGEEITVLEGSKVKDKATLSGTNASKAGGTVKYKVYSDKECKTLVAEAGEVTVSSGSVPASNEEELEGGKTYYWQASYSGDSKNKSSISTCGSEILNVKAKTSLSTELSGEGSEGEEITILDGSEAEDKATLSGTNSSTAGGKAVYKIYSDNKCEHLVTEAGEVTVSSGKIPTSSEEELEGGETYYWQATYDGDSLHQESKSTCGKATLNVKALTCTLPYCEPTITPGVKLNFVSVGTCTAGPIMTKGTEMFLLTAGHCLGYGNEETETVPQEVRSAYPKNAPAEKEIGGNVTFNNSKEYDTAEVKIEKAEWLQAGGGAPAKLVEWKATPKVMSVVGKAANKVGEETCLTGASSGAVHCGVILRTGAFRSKTENLIETTADGASGDSGAPEFASSTKGIVIQGTYVGGGKETISGPGTLTNGSNQITSYPSAVEGGGTTCGEITTMKGQWPTVPVEGKGIPAKTTVTKCKEEAGAVTTIEMSAKATENGSKVEITIGYKELGWYEPMSQIEAVYKGQALLVK